MDPSPGGDERPAKAKNGAQQEAQWVYPTMVSNGF